MEELSIKRIDSDKKYNQKLGVFNDMIDNLSSDVNKLHLSEKISFREFTKLFSDLEDYYIALNKNLYDSDQNSFHFTQDEHNNNKKIIYQILQEGYFDKLNTFKIFDIKLLQAKIAKVYEDIIVKKITFDELSKYSHELQLIQDLILKGEDYNNYIINISNIYNSIFFSSLEKELNLAYIPIFLVYSENNSIYTKIKETIEEKLNLDKLKIASLKLHNEYSSYEIFVKLLNKISNNNENKGHLMPLDLIILKTQEIVDLIIKLFINSNLEEISNCEIDLSYIKKAIYKLISYSNDEKINKMNEHLSNELKSIKNKNNNVGDYISHNNKFLLKCISESLIKESIDQKYAFRFILMSIYSLIYENNEINVRERKFFTKFYNYFKELEIGFFDEKNIFTIIEILHCHFLSDNKNYENIKKYDYQIIESGIINSKLKKLYQDNIFINYDVSDENTNTLTTDTGKFNLKKEIKNSLFKVGKSLFKEIFKNNNKNTDIKDVQRNLEINPKYIFLKSYNTLKTYYPTVTILISGFLSQCEEQEKLWKDALNLKDLYTDFYTMNWQSSSYSDLGVNILSYASTNLIKAYLSRGIHDIKLDDYLNNSNEFITAKNRSKKIGKLLAYMLASRNIFQDKVVNLVGFSLGCNVVKHCLKELAYIQANCNIRTENILNNVYMMGGATIINLDKPSTYNTLNIIGNKLINCYSKHDMILSKLFKIVSKDKEAAGSIKLEVNIDHTYYNFYNSKIINIDFSEENVGHFDYRTTNRIKRILKKGSDYMIL